MAKDLEQLAKTITADQGRMVEVRRPRESTTKQINLLFRPERTDIDDNKQEGDKLAPKNFLPEAELALYKWKNAFAGSTAAQRLDWFNYGFSAEAINGLDVAQIYLQEAREQMRNAFERSNFYDESIPMIGDAGADGNGFMEPIHDLDTNQAMFQTEDPGDVWISRDKYGKINRVHIRKKMTAEAAYDTFKDSEYQGQKLVDKLPDELIANATGPNGNPLAKYEFVHARWKNPDRRMGSILSEDKEFLNAWVCSSNQEIVELNGVDRLILAWTPNRVSRNVYGTGLAQHALTAALMGNVYEKKSLMAFSINAEGRYKASKTLRGRFDRRPGGTTYMNDGEVLEMLTDKTNFSAVERQSQKFIDTIDDWFWLDLFLAVSGIENPKDVTAFYVSQLQGEKAQVLTSTTTAYESFLDEVQAFVWDIEEQAGRMPPVPDELQQAINQYSNDGEDGVIVQPNYIGPLFQIQREFLKTGPIQKGLDMMERITEQFPESKVKVDGDKLLEEALDATGFPEKIQRTDVEVEEIRAVEAAALAQQQQQEQLQFGVENLDKLGKKIDPDSAAGQLAESGAIA
jgi:hypothetical protein